MRSNKIFSAYAPLNQNEDYIDLTRNLATFTSLSSRLFEENNEMVARSKDLAANIIKAIDSYKLTRSRRYTKMSNLFSEIDRDINFEYLRGCLVPYYEETAQTEISYNPLGLALWVYIYLNSSDYTVRITNMSRMRSCIYAVLEKEFSLTTLKSLTAHLDNLFFDKVTFLNDLIIESVHLQSFANSLIFKIIVLSRRLTLVSQLLADITHAYVPPNVIRDASLPSSELAQQLQIHLDELHNQVDEIKNEVSSELSEHDILRNENAYKKKDARSKQLFANKTLRHTLVNPIRKISETKSDDESPGGSIELRALRN